MDAMAWLYECEITWSVIDRSGERPRILATSGRYVNPVNERRQAMCGQGMPAANTGVKIFRYLLTLKLEGQADNAERILHDDVTAKEIRERINHLAVAKDISRLMGHEGQAADVYWQAWKDLPVMWNGKQPSQPHWLRYPSRRTLRRDWESNRNATDPINAMLNFGYHCAEVECILACYAAALSPAMGIGHVDDPTRASFALDLIEVMRPEVDRIILGIMCEMLDTRTFRELTGVKMGGVVQVQAPLTHRIQAEVHTAAIAITKALFTVTKMLDSPQSRRAGIKDDSD
jgi:CRISPR-associated endonuclease Cas1